MSKKKRIGIRVKLSLILLFFMVGFSVLCIRVGYLKVVHGEEYENTARTQQVSRYDTVIAPNRGTITDRNNQALAVSTTVYNIVLDVRVLVENEPIEQEKTLKALSEAFDWVDYETIKGYTEIDASTDKPKLDTSWKVLAKKQPREVKEALEAQNLKGVIYQHDTKRRYTADTMAAHVIGFIRDSMWGLEKQYNSVMDGVPGRSFITYDGTNGAVAQEIAAEDGNTIVTTLDYNIQAFAEESVKSMMTEFNPENAGTIVMDPNTGEILAMAGGLTFNLNDPTEPVALSDQAFASNWANMSSEERYDYLNKTWSNFNISSTYEPGSIFKPMVVAAALEEGVIKNSDTYYCGGYKMVADEKIHCHLRSGHGTVDVEHVLANSCNVGMMDIAVKMGGNMLYKYLKDFGFGSRTGIDLPGEVSAASLIYTPDRIGPVELATMSFGQSFNATTLQCINAFAAIINGGNLMQPYVVSQIVDKEGNVVKENKPHVVKRVVSKETSDIVRKDLVTTIEAGTGKKAKIAGYTYGGKTGTAQQGNRKDSKYTVSFVGFLPAENPQYIAITVMHKPESYSDGVTSVAPMMKDLFQKIIKYKGIEAGYEVKAGTDKENKKVMIDDYTGANLSEVLTKLDINNIKYEIVGKGNKIVNQMPHGNTEVLENTKITLYVEKGADETGSIVVPDVNGMEYEKAVTEIIDAGLLAVPEGDKTGKVVKINPKAGVTVDAGTEITLTVQDEKNKGSTE